MTRSSRLLPCSSRNRHERASKVSFALLALAAVVSASAQLLNADVTGNASIPSGQLYGGDRFSLNGNGGASTTLTPFYELQGQSRRSMIRYKASGFNVDFQLPSDRQGNTFSASNGAETVVSAWNPDVLQDPLNPRTFNADGANSGMWFILDSGADPIDIFGSNYSFDPNGARFEVGEGPTTKHLGGFTGSFTFDISAVDEGLYAGKRWNIPWHQEGFDDVIPGGAGGSIEQEYREANIRVVPGPASTIAHALGSVGLLHRRRKAQTEGSPPLGRRGPVGLKFNGPKVSIDKP